MHITDDEEDNAHVEPELTHIERATGESSIDVNQQSIPDVGVHVEIILDNDEND